MIDGFFLAFFLWLICDWRRAKCKVSTKSVAYCVARAGETMHVCVGNTRRAMSLPARLPLPLSAIAKIRFDFRSLCSLLCRTNAERANRAGSAMQWQPHLNFAHGVCVCVCATACGSWICNFPTKPWGAGTGPTATTEQIEHPKQSLPKIPWSQSRSRASTCRCLYQWCKTSKPHSVTEYYR